MQRCEIPVSPHKLWKLQRKLTPQEMLVKIGTGLSSNWKNLNSASHTNKHNTHTHTLLNFHNDPRVINSLIHFLLKSSIVTLINRWSARGPLKLIPCAIRVFFFCFFSVNQALWKRSKCVIWSASVWSLWSRLFCRASVRHLRRVAGTLCIAWGTTVER